MSKNTVAYEIIKAESSVIIGSAEKIQQVAKNISAEIEEAMQQGGTAISGESGIALKRQWDTFAEDAFPVIKQRLENLVNVKLETWKSEFEAAEAAIKAASTALESVE